MKIKFLVDNFAYEYWLSERVNPLTEYGCCALLSPEVMSQILDEFRPKEYPCLVYTDSENSFEEVIVYVFKDQLASWYDKM